MNGSAVTFRIKVTVLLCGMILMLSIIAVVRARNDMYRILGDELEGRGYAIARDLAANSTDHLLTGDLFSLYDLAMRTKNNNPDIRYLLILGPTGQVQVNTFNGGIPRGLVEANLLASGQTDQLRRLETEEALIRDVATPILGGKAGTARVGMSDHNIRAAVDENTRSLGLVVVLAMATGIAVSYGLAYYLTRPLSLLLEAVQSVTEGNLSLRIRSPGNDEVGQLGKAFNLMSEALAQKESARRALLDKVISSQEEERKRVARELHDELAQQLTSVLLSLEAIEAGMQGSDGRNRHTVQQAKNVVSTSLAETRKLIGDLRPSVLDDLGLVPAIRSYAESHLHPLQCKVLVSATDIPSELPFGVEIAAFRIVQETINNVAKHARARSVRIRLDADNDTLFGEVSDDGKGFLPDQVRSMVHSDARGLGLQGMQERASLLGGDLSIDSKVGQGTRISFCIPLHVDLGEQVGEREDSLVAGR